MPLFRKKPVVIEAEQYDSAKTQRGVCFCRLYGPSAHLHTIHEGQTVVLKHGDWIVPEPDGIHYYPIKSGIFEATYDPAPPATPETPEHRPVFSGYASTGSDDEGRSRNDAGATYGCSCGVRWCPHDPYIKPEPIGPNDWWRKPAPPTAEPAKEKA